MAQATYYRPVLIRRKYGAIFDHKGNEINEHERGLDGLCDSANYGHNWLVLPYEEGQKEYLYCLECKEHSHF